MNRSGSRAWIGAAVFLLLTAGLGWLTWRLIERGAQRQTADVIALEPGHARTFLDEPVVAPPLPLAQDPGATLVSLKLERATVQDALAALSRASGINILPQREDLWQQLGGKRVMLSLDRRPFWEAMLEICRQGGVWPSSDRDSAGSIVVGPDSQQRGRCPSIVSGSFLVTAYRIGHTVTYDAAGQTPSSGTLLLEMDLAVEPKLRQGASNDVRAVVELATDELGHALPQPQHVRSVPIPGTSYNRFHVFLTCPADAGKRIAVVKGHVAVCVEKTQTFTVSDLTKGSELIRTAEGFGVQLKPLGQDAGRAVVELELTGPSRQRLTDRFIMLRSIMTVLDENGKRLLARTGSTGPSPEGLVVKQYIDSFTGKPAKVILKVPMQASELRVPFEFKDLPLP